MINLKNCNIQSFFQRCGGKRVYVFGASKLLEGNTVFRTPDYNIAEIIYKIVDNEKLKWGTQHIVEKTPFKVISPNELRSEIGKEDIILIASIHYYEIIQQLDSYTETNQIECYIWSFIHDCFDSKVDQMAYQKAENVEFCIPPVIHYCWFGGNPMPDEYLQYMETWRKCCPNYEFVQWNENNYDISKHPYLKWAADHKKWAFVSDYARLDIIYEYGGIYLDTDVEMVKNLDDLRKFHAFAGYESTQMINTGLGIGAEKQHEIIKLLRDDYDKIDVKNFSELMPCTVYQTKALRSLGLRCNNSFQVLKNGRMVVLPTEFLCGIRLYTREIQATDNTYTLHHYGGDWGGWRTYVSEERRRQNEALLERIQQIEMIF